LLALWMFARPLERPRRRCSSVAAGVSAKCNVYCTPREDHFATFNDTYARYFSEEAPARIFPYVPSFLGPFDVEADCVAVLRSLTRAARGSNALGHRRPNTAPDANNIASRSLGARRLPGFRSLRWKTARSRDGTADKAEASPPLTRERRDSSSHPLPRAACLIRFQMCIRDPQKRK
jgi:hypothetical protein